MNCLYFLGTSCVDISSGQSVSHKLQECLVTHHISGNCSTQSSNNIVEQEKDVDVQSVEY